MSQFRLARISLLLAAIGLHATPALLSSAHAQAKPAAAPAAEAPKETVRPEMFKLLEPTAFKQLLDAKNFTEMQAKITAAEAMPNPTPYESYAIGRMKLALASASGNNVAQITALEYVLSTGRLSAQEKDEFTVVLANNYFQQKNYPKAIEVSKRYVADGGSPEKVRVMLSRAYYLNNDFANAKTELLPLIAAVEAKGAVPTKEDLGLLGSSASKLKDEATYMATMEKLVRFYPNDEFWTDLLNRMQRKPGWNDRFRHDVLRLEDMAIKTLAPEEYVEFAERSLQAGFPTEAKKVLDEGFTAGVLNSAAHKKLRDQANKQAADDAKNISKGEASAAKSKDGTGLVNLGWAYVTMDQYDKGIGFIEQGIAKGGLKRADEARLKLAIAHAKAGHKDEAVKQFDALKSNDGLTDLSKYWVMYLTAPASTAAAPAAK